MVVRQLVAQALAAAAAGHQARHVAALQSGTEERREALDGTEHPSDRWCQQPKQPTVWLRVGTKTVELFNSQASGQHPAPSLPAPTRQLPGTHLHRGIDDLPLQRAEASQPKHFS